MNNLKALKILAILAEVNTSGLLEKDCVTIQELEDAFFMEQYYAAQVIAAENGQPIDMVINGMV